MKQNFNLHTHTQRCKHAVGLDEQYIRAAIDAGMKAIGFSDHIPYPCIEKPGERMLNEDVNEYLATMNELKEKYKDQIEIFVGFEFEYFDDQKEYLLEMKNKCDYMIVGQHFKYVTGYTYDHYCTDEDVLTYAHQIESALKYGITRYVAHPDLFMLGRRQWNDACRQAMTIIIEAALKYDAVLEINLNGLRYGQLYYEDGKQYAYPRYEAFKMISQSRCCVCFGYDAHHPTTLLEHHRVDECLQILKDLDFCYVKDVHEIITL